MAQMAKREGYLLVDHSASPGLPEDVARRSGYDPKLCREGKKFEAATLTCKHCRCTVVKNPLRTRAREVCFKCGCQYICDFCHAAAQAPDYNHMPFEKMIDLSLSAPQPYYGITSMGAPPAALEKLILPPDFNRETV